ncbi:MAG TPA: PAS domain-containing protein [Rhizomicrobium sp.]|nr:PAS domain-containing protein [Rhizomicrobium sp.]
MQALGLVWGDHHAVNANLREVRAPIGEPTQYGAKLLLEQWRARTDTSLGFVVGRDVPSRALAPILRSLAIYEPLEGMKDFRIRLAGTAFVRRFGRDVTGARLSDLYAPEAWETQCRALASVVESGSPNVGDVKITRDNRVYIRFESLSLPVLSPDSKDIWVMSGIFYFDWA